MKQFSSKIIIGIPNSAQLVQAKKAHSQVCRPYLHILPKASVNLMSHPNHTHYGQRSENLYQNPLEAVF